MKSHLPSLPPTLRHPKSPPAGGLTRRQTLHVLNINILKVSEPIILCSVLSKCAYNCMCDPSDARSDAASKELGTSFSEITLLSSFAALQNSHIKVYHAWTRNKLWKLWSGSAPLPLNMFPVRLSPRVVPAQTIYSTRYSTSSA